MTTYKPYIPSMQGFQRQKHLQWIPQSHRKTFTTADSNDMDALLRYTRQLFDRVSQACGGGGCSERSEVALINAAVPPQ